MPLNLETAHWSRPAGVRTLLALRRLGGSATTWQIADQTKSLAAHSEVHHARCLCQAEGICDGEVAIVRTYEGRSESDRSIQRYTLHPAVQAALKRGWLEDEMQEMMLQDPGRRQKDGARRPAAVDNRDHEGAQALLFRHHLPPYLRQC